MLLLKTSSSPQVRRPDTERLTCYELIAYPFEIIIGLQRYGFSDNWQAFSPLFFQRDAAGKGRLTPLLSALTDFLFSSRRLREPPYVIVRRLCRGNTEVAKKDRRKARLAFRRWYGLVAGPLSPYYLTMSSGNLSGMEMRFHVS